MRDSISPEESAAFNEIVDKFNGGKQPSGWFIAGAIAVAAAGTDYILKTHFVSDLVGTLGSE